MARFRLLTPDLTDVARTQHKATPYRAPMVLVVGLLSCSSIGVHAACGWIAAVMAGEVWTWFATRPALQRPLSQRELGLYVLSGAYTLPAWSALGLLFWCSPGNGRGIIALAIWMTQLLYTQRFIFQSYTAMLLGNTVIVAVLLFAPVLYPRLGMLDTILLETAIAFSLGFAVEASLTAHKRIRSLADQNAVIEHAASHDALTGLPNRQRLNEVLNKKLREGAPFAMLYMDLDRFKLVNDTLGHQAGDALLVQFAQRLRAVCPAHAAAARLGGDEFAVLVDLSQPAPHPSIEALCREIIAATRAPFAVPNGHAHVGVSIGVSTGPSADAAPYDPVREADIALYAAKAAGRGDVRVFSAELDHAVRDRGLLEGGLRAALADKAGLSLVYQPIVGRSGRAQGVEALVRWRRDGESVSPGRFIPVAEETGLIVPLGAWVFEEVVSFAARSPDLCVAVNVSPVQLRDPGFVAFAITCVRGAGVPAARIELEVTETALFEASETATRALDTLRAEGFRVALDDFGTGFSSMRHLHRLSIDRVKIDRSFVEHVGSSAESAAIVRAIVQLGHAMGLQITAEGVETDEQFRFLLEAGADELQGYLFSPPVAEADLGPLVAEPLFDGGRRETSATVAELASARQGRAPPIGRARPISAAS